MILGIVETIVEFFQSFLIGLVAFVYNIVAYLYEIFTVLANTNIFKEEHYTAIMDKVYVILGVIMLFIMAYNFLMLVVDPDKNKGGASVEKLLKNIVTSFILIVVTPALFTFAFDLQAAFLKSNIIASFFSSTNAGTYDANKTVKEGGQRMAGIVFDSFFVAEYGGKDSDKTTMNSSEAGVYTYKDDEGRTIKVDCSDTESCSLAEVKEAAKHGVGFSAFKAFALNAAGGGWSDYAVDFSWIISLVAGCFLVWVILSFCFDLATRVVKLAFMQIIAPIAITARIIPDNDVFKNWWKTTLQTYTSVFIRIFIMHLGVYLIRIVHEMEFFQNNCDGCSWGVTLLGNAFIIMGIVAFMKAAASLIDKIFNLGGDIKLGLSDMKDRLKGGGAFAAGAAVGSGATSLLQGATKAGMSGRKAFQEARDSGASKWKAFGAAMGSAGKEMGRTAYMLPGSVARGGKAGLNAGSWSETWAASQKGASDSFDALDARDARKTRYRASGKNMVTGRLSDIGNDVKDWATRGAAQYDSMIQVGKAFDSKNGEIESATESMMNKFKANAGLVATMTKDKFKGDDSQVARYMNLYDNYRSKGMSLAAISADIEQQRSMTDFASMVDKEKYYSSVDYTALEAARQQAVAAIDKNSKEFQFNGRFDKSKYDEACKAARESVQEAAFRTFDNASYQAAIQSLATEHSNRMADLDQMYTQLWKESRLSLVDRANAGDWVPGTKEGDYRDIITASREFEELFAAHGNRVVDPDDPSKEFSKIDRKVKAGHTMDDIASAYKKKGKDASAASAHIRQQADMRKNDKK